jgi:methylated-DNA-[protein]-cysteine S-methyltransferase
MSAKPPETFLLDRQQTPIGPALLVTDADGALRAFDWEDHAARVKELLRLQYGAVRLTDARAPQEVRAALSAYFKGDLAVLGTINWRTAGTPFQRKCGPRCQTFRRAPP